MFKTLYISANTNVLSQGINCILSTDFNPCRPFFVKHQIPLESIQFVHTTGVLETTPFIREVIKRIDDLVAVNGLVNINYFSQGDPYVGGDLFRPLSFFMNEWSVCTEDRYKLEERIAIDDGFTLRFRKIYPKHLPYDTLQRWTFGIVSDGKKDNRIQDIIEQIKAFCIPEFEVIICGPTPYKKYTPPAFVKILSDTDLYTDIRVPISKKKNRIIEAARFENLVLMHDRISFATDWYQKICDYGNTFDILCPQILALEDFSKRVQDWLEFNGKFGDTRSLGRQLEYNEWSSNIYVDGGFLIAKTRLLRQTQYSQFLHWGEGEDVDLSQRLYQGGALISLYTDLKVFTETHRHKGLPIKKEKSIAAYIKQKSQKLRSKLKQTHHKEIKNKLQAFSKFCNTWSDKALY